MHWTMNKSTRSPALPRSSTTTFLLPMSSLPASLSPQRQQIPFSSLSFSVHSVCMSQLSPLSHASLSSDSFRSISLLPHRVTSFVPFQLDLCVSAPPARSLLSRLRDGIEKWWVEVLGFARVYSDQECNMSSNSSCPAYPDRQSQLKDYSRYSCFVQDTSRACS